MEKIRKDRVQGEAVLRKIRKQAICLSGSLESARFWKCPKFLCIGKPNVLKSALTHSTSHYWKCPCTLRSWFTPGYHHHLHQHQQHYHYHGHRYQQHHRAKQKADSPSFAFEIEQLKTTHVSSCRGVLDSLCGRYRKQCWARGYNASPTSTHQHS